MVNKLSLILRLNFSRIHHS